MTLSTSYLLGQINIWVISIIMFDEISARSIFGVVMQSGQK